MSRNMNWKSWAILGLAVAVLAASGTMVMASNMGFKINKALTASYVATKAPVGQNWVALPYANPYPKAKDFCNSAGVTTNVGTVSQVVPTTGATRNFACGGLAGSPLNFLIDKKYGIRWYTTAATPTNVVLVGSSDEALSLTVVGGFVATAAPKGDNWISVPYHTVWIKAKDVCNSLGQTTNVTTISRLTPAGAYQNFLCGGLAGSPLNFSLVIGEGVRVRKTTVGDVTILPPHF